jgi:uncharacterized protein (DUF433 family)
VRLGVTGALRSCGRLATGVSDLFGALDPWYIREYRPVGTENGVRKEMSELHRVTVDPEQCGGRPCIRGMRIRVSDVLQLLANGASHEEILADYPYLEDGDIVAALEYAARQLDHAVLT